MKDALFGEVEYEYGWTGKCSWPIFGREVVTDLAIPFVEPNKVEKYQRDAFAAFEERKGLFGKLAEEAIFKYYREILPEYRERFGESADEWAPDVNTLDEVGSLVTPEAVIVQQSFADRPERIIGLLFHCTWDPSLGLAVKFVDERLSEVGTQDIVL